MKVQFTDDAKRFITVSEIPAVRKMIKDLKEDDCLYDYAKQIVYATVHDAWDVKVLEARAEICKNSRAWNAFGDDTGNLDVWIGVIAYFNGCPDGFVRAGANLTDVWSLSGRDDDAEIVSHMYVRTFKEA